MSFGISSQFFILGRTEALAVILCSSCYDSLKIRVNGFDWVPQQELTKGLQADQLLIEAAMGEICVNRTCSRHTCGKSD
jgi:hypothetical protein